MKNRDELKAYIEGKIRDIYSQGYICGYTKPRHFTEEVDEIMRMIDQYIERKGGRDKTKDRPAYQRRYDGIDWRENKSNASEENRAMLELGVSIPAYIYRLRRWDERRKRRGQSEVQYG